MNNILKLFGKFIMGLLISLLQLIWFTLLFKGMDTWIGILWIFSLIVSFGVVLFIFSQKLIPETKLFWAILILLFPIFGVSLYFICHFSCSFIRLKERIKIQEQELKKYKYQDEKIIQKIKHKSENIYSQINYFHNNGFSVYENCKVDYYPYGRDAYKDMLVALKQAKHYIFIEYFIISEGYMWEEILDILKEKTMNGIEVRILYDDIGSAFHLKKNYILSLVKYNIQIMSFYPKTFFPYTDNRNHRKTLIVDGEIAFTGGINIADECIRRTNKYGIWKDSLIRVKGVAVFEFTKMFLVMWNANITNKLRTNICYDQDYEHYKGKTKSYQCSGYIIPYGHNPFNQKKMASRVYLNIINQATKYLYIYTPYLILDEVIKESLLVASKRGVEIKIITPGIPDKKLVYQVTRSYYSELLDSGIKIYEYIPGFLHAKCFLCDDEVATVGAINLDYRSLYTHFENGCYFYQGNIIKTIKDDFNKTLEDSREVILVDLKKNFFERIIQIFLNLFSPLL